MCMYHNEIVSQSNDKTSELSSVERTARLNNEHLHFDALWELSFLLNWYDFLGVAIVWNVTNLSFSIISSFKRSWELLTGVSTCLYDLSTTWSWKRTSKEQTKQIFQYTCKRVLLFWRRTCMNSIIFCRFSSNVDNNVLFSSSAMLTTPKFSGIW